MSEANDFLNGIDTSTVSELEESAKNIVKEDAAQKLIRELDVEGIGRLLTLPVKNQFYESAAKPGHFVTDTQAIGYSLPLTAEDDNADFLLIFTNGRRLHIGPGVRESEEGNERMRENFAKIYGPNVDPHIFRADHTLGEVIKGFSDLGRVKADSGDKQYADVDFDALQDRARLAGRIVKAKKNQSPGEPPQQG